MDIIEKLLELQKQATLEKSHYYVAACVTEAIQGIQALLLKNEDLESENENLHIENDTMCNRLQNEQPGKCTACK